MLFLGRGFCRFVFLGKDVSLLIDCVVLLRVLNILVRYESGGDGW